MLNVYILTKNNSKMLRFTNTLKELSQRITGTSLVSCFFGFTMIVIFVMTSSFNTVDSESFSVCVPPPIDPGALAPTSYDIDVEAVGTISWSSLVGKDPEKITNKIRITGNGTVIIPNSNLKLEGSDAAVVIEGATLLIENGDIQIESSGAKFIMNNGVLRTHGNVQQKPNSILAITDSEVEIGDEVANGIFTNDGNSGTSANFQNDGGYRYLNNVCLNITHDYQLESTGSGIGLSGVDVLINVCMEVGDRGANHATPTDFGVADGDDSGNFQNSNRMFIHDSSIVIANGDFQNNSGTITFCNLRTKLNKSGNFQNNDGTFRGEDLCVAAGMSLFLPGIPINKMD